MKETFLEILYKEVCPKEKASQVRIGRAVQAKAIREREIYHKSTAVIQTKYEGLNKVVIVGLERGNKFEDGIESTESGD